jgi:hypothetical protein
MSTTTHVPISGRVLRWLVAPATLVERTRGRRRLALLALYAVILAGGGAFAWRWSNLLGVPDIGDPFDEKAFLAFTIPPERNAYTWYIRAQAILVADRTRGSWGNNAKLGQLDWKKTTPEQKSWVLQNREALDLWRQGTEKTEAMPLSPRQIAKGTLSPVWEQEPFGFLVELEASRLMAEGDMAGAWGWYLAWLRSIRHQAMHGGRFDHRNAERHEAAWMAAAMRWAGDQRVDPTLLERAVADVREAETLVPTKDFTLKAEYLDLMRSLDDSQKTFWRESQEGHPYEAHIEFFGYRRAFPGAAVRFLRGEPELSRRVIRMVFANWLAQVNRPSPRLAFRVVVPPDPAHYNGSWSLNLYEVPQSALPPEALGRHFAKSWDAKRELLSVALDLNLWVRGSSRRGELAYLLAEEWYRREHAGQSPPSPQALLGRYLASLPVPDPAPADAEDVPVLRVGEGP